MNTQNEPVLIEDKILAGITVRNVLWIISGLISILVAIITTYASIMNKLDKNQEAITEIRRGKELTDMQMKTIQMQLQTIEIRLVRLETQLNTGK
jgi:hypothetical protein